MCDKKFTQSGSRRQHLIRHHLDDEIRESLKKQQGAEAELDADEDGEYHLGRNARIGVQSLKSLVKKSELTTSLSNRPRLMLLKNTYQGNNCAALSLLYMSWFFYMKYNNVYSKNSVFKISYGPRIIFELNINC